MCLRQGLRVAVIGTGISGVQAMKACIAEGIEPVGFESDSDTGGFWRFKESTDHPSVYRSTHIDTSRDMNSFGDRPWDPEKPLLIHNTELTEYLRANIEEFGLSERIRLGTKVLSVSPEGPAGAHSWCVRTATADGAESEEHFDGVMVCTGRHGGGAWVPAVDGIDTTSVPHLHSSKYKYPEKHGIGPDSTVVVVGIGNSGSDIVTELGPVAKRTILVARSGGYVAESRHMELEASEAPGDRLMMSMAASVPWFMGGASRRNPVNDTGVYATDGPEQQILNEAGMTPAHVPGQQHGIVSGLSGQQTLHQQVKAGQIEVRRGIDRFTDDGVVFAGESEATEVDVVVFATGFRQAVDFIDPAVV